METAVLIVLIVAALVVVAATWGSAAHLLQRRLALVVLLLAGVALPLGASATGVFVGVKRSSRTSFCVECHEMTAYGQSLFVDNPDALSAVHYQKRLISRDETCFACHTDYAMFGDVKAKLNGLLHVWVHYAGEAEAPLKLYQPYPNHNCLHCHDDARSFMEVDDHQTELAKLRDDTTSCLSCHEVGHDLAGVTTKNFWLGATP